LISRFRNDVLSRNAISAAAYARPSIISTPLKASSFFAKMSELTARFNLWMNSAVEKDGIEL
jgi:hypothetical protein